MHLLPRTNLKLLIVDDDANTRELLRDALSVCGAHVRASATAREAHRTLVAWHPDLVISDLGMPRENGYDLIRRVRHLSEQEGGKTPVIACTGYTRTEVRERALHAGFDAVVTKPVDLAVLVETIAHVAGRDPGSEADGPGAPDAEEAAPDGRAPSDPDS